MATTFDDAMRAILESIPPARVATCGTVASALGDVRASRAVAAWVLDHPDATNADRVVRADLRPLLVGRGRVGLDGRQRKATIRTANPVRSLPARGLLSALRDEQTRLAFEVREEDNLGTVGSIGGVDVAYDGDRAFAAAVRCDAQSLEPTDIAKLECRADFPYIPGYLAFREFPLVERVVGRWTRAPDLLLVDGHGRLHPALFGFACYTGVRLNVPTVGVAKHLLCGRLRPAEARADGSIPVVHRDAVRGYAWRPGGYGNPLYVSVGHRISLQAALSVVQRVTRARNPEPLRIADRLSKEMKKSG